MCNFFSFVTNPDASSDFYYFDWQMRQSDNDGADSHSHICAHFGLDEDRCNKYEYNPLTKRFVIDMQNAEKDDSVRAKRWVVKLNFKTIVEPLVIKPIVKPFELPKVSEPTEEQIGWLKVWASVGDSVCDSVRNTVCDTVGASVWASVWGSVRASVGASVWDSVRDSVGGSIWDSVWDSVGGSIWDSDRASVWAYCSSYFTLPYKYDISTVTKLWEAGLLPSFDGKVWRLHSGERADVVYEWKRGA